MRFVPLFVLWWASCATAQTFHVEPANPILVGEPLSIKVDGLPADQNVTLTAERSMAASSPEGSPVLYRSQVVFSAPQGTLDLATAKPVSGTYTDADIHGLFWSMAPVAGGELGGLQPLQVKLTATVEGRVLASATIEFIDALPEVEVEQVKQFPGAVFATLPSNVPRPALIVLGGSEGGGWVARDRSPRFASRGFAVLGLPYYSPGAKDREIPELPAAFADIPVERLDAAFAWLKARPEVDASRVALVGVSKGRGVRAHRGEPVQVDHVGRRHRAHRCRLGRLGSRGRAGQALVVRVRRQAAAIRALPRIRRRAGGLSDRARGEDAALPGQGPRGRSGRRGEGAHRGGEIPDWQRPR